MNKIGVLTVEYQKNWTDRGFFYQLIKRQYQQNHVLENTKELLNFARKKQHQVFHAPLILDKNDQYRYAKAPFPARLFGQLKKGTWRAEHTEGIYQKGDKIVKGRSSYDACIDSDLVQLLKENQIKTVVLCGFTTDHCVQETFISLEKEGFRCILAKECTAAMSNAKQLETENNLTPATNKELFHQLS